MSRITSLRLISSALLGLYSYLKGSNAYPVRTESPLICGIVGNVFTAHFLTLFGVVISKNPSGILVPFTYSRALLVASEQLFVIKLYPGSDIFTFIDLPGPCNAECEIGI